jgi:hypothetical protein
MGKDGRKLRPAAFNKGGTNYILGHEDSSKPSDPAYNVSSQS